ncbi:MAG: DUF3943 domain-containing protein [Muribaculaceae bacterium]|nr:DUF3943 domain-containing protein [Muribaculaceae bacterium]
MRFNRYFIILLSVLSAASAASAEEIEFEETVAVIEGVKPIAIPDSVTPNLSAPVLPMSKPGVVSIYDLPYSLTRKSYDRKRLWINTAVLTGAFVGTLVVLECLPEDATSWNRAELQKDPWYRRWFENVFKKGPEWDHDNPIFNYVLHPYAGAAYFMAARSCGYNFYQSLLYCAAISTIGWEFGIEACMERPSIQDIFITPLVGSVIGELFYKLKRHIVANDYRLFGSPVIGNVVAFLIDPVNEVVGLFGGNRERKLHLGSKTPAIESSFTPAVINGACGFSFTCTF